MHSISSIRLVLCGLMIGLILVFCSQSFAQVGVGIYVNFAPPDLPVYDQPECPGPDYIWTPGYWAWTEDTGYYWVPGTWVMVPEPGYYWTPGYWAWGGNGFFFTPGYWGPVIGFYGGIDYGYGYFGHGYEGGRWDNGRFYYNRTVNNVNVNVIHNTYNTTVVNNTVTRVSYNGGEGGLSARPRRRSRRRLASGILPQSQLRPSTWQRRAPIRKCAPRPTTAARPLQRRPTREHFRATESWPLDKQAQSMAQPWERAKPRTSPTMDALFHVRELLRSRKGHLLLNKNGRRFNSRNGLIHLSRNGHRYRNRSGHRVSNRNGLPHNVRSPNLRTTRIGPTRLIRTTFLRRSILLPPTPETPSWIRSIKSSSKSSTTSSRKNASSYNSSRTAIISASPSSRPTKPKNNRWSKSTSNKPSR